MTLGKSLPLSEPASSSAKWRERQPLPREIFVRIQRVNIGKALSMPAYNKMMMML